MLNITYISDIENIQITITFVENVKTSVLDENKQNDDKVVNIQAKLTDKYHNISAIIVASIR